MTPPRRLTERPAPRRPSDVPGGGRPLDDATRAVWESRLEADLRNVRVHDGPQAAGSARRIGARAYTTGCDIVFRDGAYQPRTAAGNRLLGHELAHVLQQGSSRAPAGIQMQPEDEAADEKLAIARSVLSAAATDPRFPDDLSDEDVVRQSLIVAWAAEHVPDPYQRSWAGTVRLLLESERDRRASGGGFLPVRPPTSKVYPARETFPADKSDFDADELEQYGARLAPAPGTTVPAAPAVIAGAVPQAGVPGTTPAPPPPGPVTRPVSPQSPLRWEKPPPVRTPTVEPTAPAEPVAPAEPAPAPVEEPAAPLSPGLVGVAVAATIIFSSTEAGRGSDVVPETEKERRRRRRGCFAPSQAYDEPIPQGWGAIAEYVIEGDYCKEFGCDKDDWFDRNNPLEMVRFLVDHNPDAIGARRAARLMASVGSLRRPDIISHKRRRKEYYEIEPDSRSGRAAGRAKLAELATFMRGNDLPYAPGTTYEPFTIRMPRITPGPIIGLPTGYDYLLVRLAEPGLVVYRVCDTSLLSGDE